MTEFDRKQAIEAANENRDLQSRLSTLRDEEQDKKSEAPSGSGQLAQLKSKSEDMRNEISYLKSELADLRRTNATQLYHTYTQLSTKLAYLNNENMGLRAVLSNQRQGVRKATRAFHDHQVRRKRNDQNNTNTKHDIQMIRSQREKCVGDTQELRKEKGTLESELEDLPPVGKGLASLQKKLLAEYNQNATEIEALENEINAEEEKSSPPPSNEESDEDLEDLREDYKELKQELKEAKKSRNHH